MSEYHCPNCGNKIGFGESICPNCKSDVTGVWEQSSPKNDVPKIAPGMGGLDDSKNSPFPPKTNANAGSPFPPPATDLNAGSPFPPPATDLNAGSPFPPPSASKNSPFPPRVDSSPFSSPSQESKPFPPVAETPSVKKGDIYLEIPRTGAKIMIPEGEIRIGRDEIQGASTIALKDLNAYKNISRKRENSEHFIILNQNGKISINDRNSTNGTYIGSEKITGTGPRDLKDGDTFILPMEEYGVMVQLEIILKINKD